MNKKLLQQSALDCLQQYVPSKDKVFAQVSAYDAAWLAIAFSRLDAAHALYWLGQSLAMQASDAAEILSPPIQGWAMGHLYKTAKDKPAMLEQLRPMHAAVLRQHLYLYEHHDWSEDGLIGTGSADEGMEGLDASKAMRVEAPLFNTFLINSNECLIHLGSLLREKVNELIDYNELSVWSMNAKLWQERVGLYWPFDVQQRSVVASKSIAGLLPMLAGIPVQEQAELMLDKLTEYWQVPAFRKNIPLNWLLYRGLLRYGMRETAADLKRDTLAIALAQPVAHLRDAVVCIEWLCANR